MAINETNVRGSKNEKITFQWHLKKGGYKDIYCKLFRGSSPDIDNMLVKDLRKPYNKSIALFGHRLLKPKIIGDEERDQEYLYVVTITNLQYSDRGLFYLEAQFVPGQEVLNSTIKLIVEGMQYLLYS